MDISKIKYRVAVTDESGNTDYITDYIQKLGWEENKKEISVRLSFTARNDKTSKGYLSNRMKPGCLIGIFASGGGAFDEVARGYVETWNTVEKSDGNDLTCTCYDELYRLQKSQDHRYYPSGTGTKSVLQGIFQDWNIPQGEYQGPNASHGKTVCNNQYLSDIILGFLDDAAKRGERTCMIRAEKGYTKVIPRGNNETIYVFQLDNTQSFCQSISTENLITRVKVIGQANDDGKRSVDVTKNGELSYGIRQRIYTRGSDESIHDASTAAQKILDEEGKIERTMTVQSPDVPWIRKGDLVYLICGSISAYYSVESIQHNAEIGQMAMELEYTKQIFENISQNAQEKKKYQVGDLVNFHGGTHYVSSYSGAKGYPATAGTAKITKKDGAGKAHPWHLIHADRNSNVYGWVDDGTFE